MPYIAPASVALPCAVFVSASVFVTVRFHFLRTLLKDTVAVFPLSTFTVFDFCSAYSVGVCSVTVYFPGTRSVNSNSPFEFVFTVLL